MKLRKIGSARCSKNFFCPINVKIFLSLRSFYGREKVTAPWHAYHDEQLELRTL